eukprot:Sspe_Gene.55654::Locus_30598_Transcript_1_1_Confidence_1.000_Length_2622::g.55654::m.55654
MEGQSILLSSLSSLAGLLRKVDEKEEVHVADATFLRANLAPDQIDEGLEGIYTLQLRGKSIGQLTRDLQECKKLRSLDLTRNALREIPQEAVNGLSDLKEIIADNNRITSFEPSAALRGLVNLSLIDNSIRHLPSYRCLVNLQTLSLEGNKLESLKPLDGLPQLTTLNAARNRIKSLEGITKLPRLSDLHLGHNQLTSLAGLEVLTALEDLDLSYNRITDIPHRTSKRSNAAAIAASSPLRGLQKLTHLNLRHNRLASLGFLTSLPVLIELLLSHNALGGQQQDEPPPSPTTSQAPSSVFDSIDEAGYLSDESDAVTAPSRTPTTKSRQAQRRSSTTAPSVASTSASKATDGAQRVASLKVIADACPLLEVLDISDNVGYIKSYTDLSALSKCSRLSDLRIYGSVVQPCSTLDGHVDKVLEKLPKLEMLDTHVVQVQQQMVVEDLEGMTPQQQEELHKSGGFDLTITDKVLFKRINATPSACSLNQTMVRPSSAQSGAKLSRPTTPSVRPGTASRPSTASGRPPMRPLSAHSATARGSVMSTDDAKATIMDTLERLRTLRDRAATRAANISAALATLPKSITELPKTIGDVTEALEGKRSAPTPAALPSTPPPSSPSSTSEAKNPTPPPKETKTSYRRGSTPARAPASPPPSSSSSARSSTVAAVQRENGGLTTKPLSSTRPTRGQKYHHLEKRPLETGKGASPTTPLNFVDEARALLSMQEARKKKEDALRDKLLQHHLQMLQGKKAAPLTAPLKKEAKRRTSVTARPQMTDAASSTQAEDATPLPPSSEPPSVRSSIAIQTEGEENGAAVGPEASGAAGFACAERLEVLQTNTTADILVIGEGDGIEEGEAVDGEAE